MYCVKTDTEGRHLLLQALFPLMSQYCPLVFQSGVYFLTERINRGRNTVNQQLLIKFQVSWGFMILTPSVHPPPGLFESRVCEGPDEAGLLPSLSWPGLSQTLL